MTSDLDRLADYLYGIGDPATYPAVRAELADPTSRLGRAKTRIDASPDWFRWLTLRIGQMHGPVAEGPPPSPTPAPAARFGPAIPVRWPQSLDPVAIALELLAAVGTALHVVLSSGVRDRPTPSGEPTGVSAGSRLASGLPVVATNDDWWVSVAVTPAGVRWKVRKSVTEPLDPYRLVWYNRDQPVLSITAAGDTVDLTPEQITTLRQTPPDALRIEPVTPPGAT